jgi:hypothetical protein
VASLIWWVSSYSGLEKTYFTKNDIIFFQPLVSDFFAQLARYLFGAIVLFSFIKLAIHFFDNKRINWSKQSLLFSTYLWFSFIIFFNSRAYFFGVLVYIHALSYIFHVYRDSSNNFRRWGRPRRDLVLCCVAIVGLGILWHIYERWSYQYAASVQVKSWVEVVAWYPLMIHYYFDATMWKSSQAFQVPLVSNLVGVKA